LVGGFAAYQPTNTLLFEMSSGNHLKQRICGVAGGYTAGNTTKSHRKFSKAISCNGTMVGRAMDAVARCYQTVCAIMTAMSQSKSPKSARPSGGNKAAAKSPAGRGKPSSAGAVRKSGLPAKKRSSPAKPAAPRRVASNKDTPRPRNRKPLLGNLSLDRKLDLTGVIMALVGVLTLLSLLSSSHGSLTGSWVSMLQSSFGWGMYIFPLALIILGLWLVLRNFERIPRVSVERVFGLILLYLNLLAVFHFFTFPETREASFSTAQAGSGHASGRIEAQNALGLGAAIALGAWFLIALALTRRVGCGPFAWRAAHHTAAGCLG
jgi:hypothetical protein